MTTQPGTMGAKEGKLAPPACRKKLMSCPASRNMMNLNPTFRAKEGILVPPACRKKLIGSPTSRNIMHLNVSPVFRWNP